MKLPVLFLPMLAPTRHPTCSSSERIQVSPSALGLVIIYIYIYIHNMYVHCNISKHNTCVYIYIKTQSLPCFTHCKTDLSKRVINPHRKNQKFTTSLGPLPLLPPSQEQGSQNPRVEPSLPPSRENIDTPTLKTMCEFLVI